MAKVRDYSFFGTQNRSLYKADRGKTWYLTLSVNEAASPVRCKTHRWWKSKPKSQKHIGVDPRGAPGAQVPQYFAKDAPSITSPPVTCLCKKEKNDKKSASVSKTLGGR